MGERARKVPTLELGDRMALTREKAGIAVSEMAQRLKMSRHTIAGWESGRHTPARPIIERWAAETGYDLGWILTGDGSVEPEPSDDLDFALDLAVRRPRVLELAQVIDMAKLRALRGRDSNSQPTGYVPSALSLPFPDLPSAVGM